MVPSIFAESVASTLKSCPASMLPSRTSARAAARTALVAITPLNAMSSPLPKELPPLDMTLLLTLALIDAASTACTTMSRPASTPWPAISACAPARTSLRTTTPPKAAESEALRVVRPGRYSSGSMSLSGSQLDLSRKFVFDRSLTSLCGNRARV